MKTYELSESEQLQKIMQLAAGRILGMMSRPFQEGDFEEYDRCKDIIYDCKEQLGEPIIPKRSNDVRQHMTTELWLSQN